MDDYFEVNKEHWNAATPLHLGPGEVYDVEAFKKGESTLLSVERELLGDVSGKSILHAQCHIGVDSMSLARLGAQVTGVDFSEEAIGAARSLNDECGLDCEFICCNIYDLPAHLDAQFDIVYASYGVLCWLPDIPRWCQLLADRLRANGTFVVIEGHPFSCCIKNDQSHPHPYIYRNYFRLNEPEFCPADDEERDYHAIDKPVGKPTYEWQHTLSNIVNAVAGAGLVIETLGEYPQAPGRGADNPEMKKGADGYFRFPAENSLYPMLLSVKAVKR